MKNESLLANDISTENNYKAVLERQLGQGFEDQTDLVVKLGEVDPGNTASNRFLHPFVRNAYRVLGLSASARRGEVVEAIAACRRAEKVQKTLKTLWDLDFIGKPVRTGTEISSTESRLASPEGRLLERLYWFNDIDEDDLAGLTLESVPGLCRRWLESNSVAGIHNAAVLQTIHAGIVDYRFENSDLWNEVIKTWVKVGDSEGYWSSLFLFDDDGGFEPPATTSEVVELHQQYLRKVLNPLVITARDALAIQDVRFCQRALGILRTSALPNDLGRELEVEIGGQLEEEFERACESFQSRCTTEVIRGDNNSKADTEANLRACDQLRSDYHEDIEARLVLMKSILGANNEAVRRAQEASALCLNSLAFAYSWANNSAESETLLKIAKGLSQGTISERQIEESLASVQEQAKAARIWNIEPIKSAPALYTNWGCGVMLYPNLHDLRFEPEFNSHLATYYITLLFIPVFPLARYRVINVGSGTTRFLGKAKLERFDQWHRLVVLVFLIWFAFGVVTSKPHESRKSNESISSSTIELNNEGVKALNANHYQIAIQNFGKALKQNPEYQLARENLSIAFNNYGSALQNHPQTAIKEFHCALYVNPANTRARENLEGMITLIHENPHSFSYRVELGDQLLSRGDTIGAAVEYTEALRLHDDSKVNEKLTAVNQLLAARRVKQSSTASDSDNKTVSERLNNLNSQIEAGRNRIKELETKLIASKDRLNSIKDQIDADKEALQSYEEQLSQGKEIDHSAYEITLDQHNSLVTEHNKILEHNGKDLHEYDALFVKDKALVKEYNSLVKQ